MNSKSYYETVKTLICVCVLTLGFGVFTKAYGQETVIEIQGTVKDTDGIPLPGASVIVVGTQTGTVSDFDGNFKLLFTSEDLSIRGGNYHFLEASFVGYQKQRIEIGDQTDFHFMLSIDNQLSETIVTAQGITREKRSIGYGVSTLTAEELSDRPYTDLGQALNGKISGVRITTLTGKSSESARVEVRTQLSLADDREPLIVVDDIPYLGELSDINIDNIKLITVLKGLSATSLYGNRGRNGVILVETKSGDQEGEFGIDFSVTQRYYTNRVATLPAYQNEYGPGLDLNFNQDSSSHYGSHFDDLDLIPHPLLEFHSDDFPELVGVLVPYEAKPDNVSKMFNPSFGGNTTLSTSARGEHSLVNASFGYANESGIFGKDHLERFTFSMDGQTQINDKLNVRASVNYSDRATLDNLGNPLGDIVNLPRNIDLTEFPYEHPIDGSSVYFKRRRENPLWVVENTQQKNQTRNFGLNLVFNYNLGEGLNLDYRGNYFQSSSFRKSDANKSGTFRSFGQAGLYTLGFTEVFFGKSLSFDQSILLSMDRVNINDKIGIDAQAGINSNQNKSESISIDAEEQLIRDNFNPENFSEYSVEYSNDRDNAAGAFLQSTINYDNYLYLTLSGRNEWGSTVEKDHRSIFYPSASLSFIPSSLFDIRSPALSLLKFRAAFASTTSFPTSYQTRPYLELESDLLDFDGNRIVRLGLSDRFANFDLRPELHKEIELGLEALLWNDRIDLNISAFKRISTDLIEGIFTRPSTGYQSAIVNLGRVESKGLEIDMDVHVIKTPDFNYNMVNLFTTGESILKESHPFASETQYRINESLSNIQGNYPLLDDEGNLLINEFGRIITNDFGTLDVKLRDKIIGDTRPDWTLSSIQQLSYKQFSLETQIEYEHGGDQVTDFFFRGALKNTLRGREDGYVIQGVLADDDTGLPILDAQGNKIKNTQIVSSQDYGSVLRSVDTFNLWDKSHIRIRDLVLHYNFNPQQLQKLKLDGLRLTFSASNLFYRAVNFPKYVNFDPRNSRGSGAINVPSNRRFSLTISTQF